MSPICSCEYNGSAVHHKLQFRLFFARITYIPLVLVHGWLCACTHPHRILMHPVTRRIIPETQLMKSRIAPVHMSNLAVQVASDGGDVFRVVGSAAHHLLARRFFDRVVGVVARSLGRDVQPRLWDRLVIFHIFQGTTIRIPLPNCHDVKRQTCKEAFVHQTSA